MKTATVETTKREAYQEIKIIIQQNSQDQVSLAETASIELLADLEQACASIEALDHSFNSADPFN